MLARSDRHALTVSSSSAAATDRWLPAAVGDERGRYGPTLDSGGEFDVDRLRSTSAAEFRCHRAAMQQLEPMTPSPGRLSEWYFNCHHHHGTAGGTGQSGGGMSADRFTLCSMPGLQPPVIAAQY